jgi:AcrR family transcriptional regulator
VARLRADAQRNRERLLATASAAFGTNKGTDVPLEEIARGAGVGTGTLYRHFPNREALIEAVFRNEHAEVVASATELSHSDPPAVALRRWMDRYANFVTTKQGMAASLRAMLAAGVVQPGDLLESAQDAIGTLLRAGAEDGSLRADIRADDVMSYLVGIFLASHSTHQTRRLLDLLVSALVTASDRTRGAPK